MNDIDRMTSRRTARLRPTRALVACIVALLVLGGCRQPPAPELPSAITPADAASQAAAETPADMVGTFVAALPCADCPGIDETLVLDASGKYTLTDVYRERPDSTFTTTGRWSVDSHHRTLRLTPDGNGRMQVYGIDNPRTLAPLGEDGQPVDSPFDLHLRRR